MKPSSNLDHSRGERLSQDNFNSEDVFNPPSTDVPSGGLLEYWRILERRKTAVIVIAFIGMCAAFLYTIPQTPIYQARTVIEIQSLNEDFLNMKDVNPNSNSSSGTDQYIELQTEVNILKSDALLDHVAQKVAAETKEHKLAPSRVQAWRRIFHLPVKAAAENTASDISASIKDLRIRNEPNTRLLEILCDSPDPSIAALYANTLASEFIEENLQARWQTTEHTGEFLGGQMQDLKVKLEKAEDAMQAYARNTNLVITDEKNNVEDLKLNQLQEELSKAQAERIQHQSQFELARSAPIDSLGEIIDDISLKGIQTQLTDLRRQYAELGTSLQPANEKMLKIKAQIGTLESAQEKQRESVIGRIRNDFEAAQRRENLLAANYADTAKIVAAQADKITHYNTLKREVDTDRQLYDSILQRVKEAGVASALRASNIHVVDPAVAPESPYRPNIFVNTVIGLLAGIAFGIAFVIFMERADRTIQEPGDTPFYIGVPELGIVPNSSVDPAGTRWPSSINGMLASNSNRVAALSTLKGGPSVLAESFRATLTSIMFSGSNGAYPQVLVVSSPSPGEGKSTLTANLAVALAEIHRRVLLIDCDLRRPSVHRFFDVTKENGMVDLLRRTEPIIGPLNGHVRASGVPNLSLITSGSSVDGDPTLLHSNRLVELIDLVRNDYDMILIDTPPMLNMSDARIIARQADGVILVVRANVTSRDSIKDAYRRFVEDGSLVIGTVLNDWNPKKSSRHSYNRYYDRYREYYTESKARG